MTIITLFGNDKSKQVIKPSHHFETNNEGDRLSKPAMEKKALELAKDILRANYHSHSIEFLD